MQNKLNIVKESLQTYDNTLNKKQIQLNENMKLNQN